MKYFYYLNKISSEEQVNKQLSRINAYYQDCFEYEGQITPIYPKSEDLPASLLHFPETLLVNGYNDCEKCSFILDNTYQVSKDKEQFIKIYIELLKKNVYLCFYKFPFLDTTNILKLSSLNDNNIDYEELKRVLSILYDVLVQSVENSKKERSAILTLAQENGVHVGRTRGRKATIEKIEKLKNFIIVNSEDFEGELSDTDVRELLQKESFNVSRNTYYRYKAELRKEKDSFE